MQNWPVQQLVSFIRGSESAGSNRISMMTGRVPHSHHTQPCQRSEKNKNPGSGGGEEHLTPPRNFLNLDPAAPALALSLSWNIEIERGERADHN